MTGWLMLLVLLLCATCRVRVVGECERKPEASGISSGRIGALLVLLSGSE